MLKRFLLFPSNEIIFNSLIRTRYKTDYVNIVEVGPRDGLQNEKGIIPTNIKVDLIDKLSDAGLKYIEVSSFVNKKLVPQMADALDVFKKIKRLSGVKYAALTPNVKGLQSAMEVKVDEVAIFASASEGFSKKNINCTISESLERFYKVSEQAKQAGLPVRGYVSCVVGCPYDGAVSPDAVSIVTEALFKQGCYQVSLGDTIGCGTPETVDALLRCLVDRFGATRLALHVHDTGGRALDNIEVALDIHGLRTVDSAVGGLGGCPFGGPGAKGNVATEAVVRRLSKGGRYQTGLDADKLDKIGCWIRDQLNKVPKPGLDKGG